MFPSSSSRNSFPCTPQTMLGQSFTNHENPNSRQEEHSSSLFLHFSPPFLDDNDELLMSHLFSQQQLLLGTTTLAQAEVSCVAASNKAATTIENEITSDAAAEPTPPKTLPKKRTNGAQKSVPRKRTGKKDRHSKIYTAQGLRDRRMRLSLQIARKFFDLQDMLGFDKASKTIDWLFTKSKAAIKELHGNVLKVKHNCTGSGKSVPCTSRGEVVPGERKIADNGDQKGFVGKDELLGGIPRERSEKSRRAAAYDPLALKKSSREKARARARERTRDKMMIRNLEKLRSCSEENPTNLELLWSSSPLETGEESGSRSQETNSSMKVVAEVEEPSTHLLEHQMDSVRIVENFLGVTRAQSSSIFNDTHNTAVSSIANSKNHLPGFPASWDVDNARSQYSSHCAMTNMNPTAGNVHENDPTLIFRTTSNAQEQNPNLISMSTSNSQKYYPNSIFMDAPNSPEQNPISIFITPSNIQEQNASSIFMTPSNPQDQNPTSLFMTTSNIHLWSQFS